MSSETPAQVQKVKSRMLYNIGILEQWAKNVDETIEFAVDSDEVYQRVDGNEKPMTRSQLFSVLEQPTMLIRSQANTDDLPSDMKDRVQRHNDNFERLYAAGHDFSTVFNGATEPTFSQPDKKTVKIVNENLYEQMPEENPNPELEDDDPSEGDITLDRSGLDPLEDVPESSSSPPASKAKKKSPKSVLHKTATRGVQKKREKRRSTGATETGRVLRPRNVETNYCL